MNTAIAFVRDFPASSAAGDDKAKGMTIWGTAWRVTAWIALAAAIAAAVAFGIHFGLAYLATLGLSETALLATQIGLGVVSAAVSFFVAWEISKRVAGVLRVVNWTKLPTSVWVMRAVATSN